jgi:hypothetical protein
MRGQCYGWAISDEHASVSRQIVVNAGRIIGSHGKSPSGTDDTFGQLEEFHIESRHQVLEVGRGNACLHCFNETATFGAS